MQKRTKQFIDSLILPGSEGLKRIKLIAVEGDFELLKEAAVSMSVSPTPSELSFIRASIDSLAKHSDHEAIETTAQVLLELDNQKWTRLLRISSCAIKMQIRYNAF